MVVMGVVVAITDIFLCAEAPPSSSLAFKALVLVRSGSFSALLSICIRGKVGQWAKHVVAAFWI